MNTPPNHIIAAHCGTNGLLLDYKDGSFDTMIERETAIAECVP